MTYWLALEALQFLAPIGALIAAMLAAVFVGRRQGADSAKAEAKKADAEGANKIERSADEARINPSTGSADDRLRAHDRLRDK